jgi:hypothetical protein
MKCLQVQHFIFQHVLGDLSLVKDSSKYITHLGKGFYEIVITDNLLKPPPYKKWLQRALGKLNVKITTIYTNKPMKIESYSPRTSKSLGSRTPSKKRSHHHSWFSLDFKV